MNNNVDYKIINGRYIFPGNIKVPVETIESMSPKEASQTLDTLNILGRRIKEANKTGKDVVITTTLSFKRKLYVCYKNNKLNMFIETPTSFTQLLNDRDLSKIPWKESPLVDKMHNVSLSIEKQEAKDVLIQTLVKSAYNERISNRGSPVVMGKKLDNDFDLDL